MLKEQHIMAKLNLSNNYVILSRDASADSNDQMFSIFKIIDSINFNASKDEITKLNEARAKEGNAAMAVNVRYVVCSSWSLPEITDKDIPVKFEYSITDPLGVVLSEQMQEAVFPKSNDIFRFNIVTEGFPYTEDGKYLVTMKILDSESQVLSDASTQIRLAVTDQA